MRSCPEGCFLLDITIFYCYKMAMTVKPAIALNSATQLTGALIRAIRYDNVGAVLMSSGMSLYAAVIKCGVEADITLNRNRGQWNVTDTANYKDTLKKPANFEGKNVHIVLHGGKPSFLMMSMNLMQEFGIRTGDLHVTRPHDPFGLYKIEQQTNATFNLRFDNIASNFIKAAMALPESEMVLFTRNLQSRQKHLDL